MMNTRFSVSRRPKKAAAWLVCAALLVGATGGVLAEGAYQKTKDGRTQVWNSDPKEGDSATWSGGRDREGYATGFGTLTWYKPRQRVQTKSNIFGSAKEAIYARYFGNMVRGKFEGPVNAHSKGKVGYAIFDNGVRTTAWKPGSAPTRVAAEKSATEKRIEPTHPETDVEKPGHKIASNRAPTPEPFAEETKPKETSAEPVRPIETKPVPVTEKVAEKKPSPAPPPAEGPSPHLTRKQIEAATAKAAANKKPAAQSDESMRSLFRPPSKLRKDTIEEAPAPAAGPPTASSSPAILHLTAAEAIELADSEARNAGYTLDQYQNPQASVGEGTWTITYDQKPDAGTSDATKPFTVTIDDSSKKTSVTAGK